MLPPKLKIKLTLVSQNLKVDDQAIITVSVENEGGSALGLAEKYTLQCSSACPFRSQSGRLKSSLKPGAQDTFRLTSNKLAAGDYGLKVKTRYGDSDWLRFSVNARPTLQRAPSQALPRVRVVPSQ
ncbi:MAG: hypothetical protein D6B25_12755 [Desulfobulbaceae bacterium]|nr:MAG: hypothetical protein D6B25_12755 [Desulfobulbaceae bacterium]